jgi:hypothetical protein
MSFCKKNLSTPHEGTRVSWHIASAIVSAGSVLKCWEYAMNVAKFGDTMPCTRYCLVCLLGSFFETEDRGTPFHVTSVKFYQTARYYGLKGSHYSENLTCNIIKALPLLQKLIWFASEICCELTPETVLYHCFWNTGLRTSKGSPNSTILFKIRFYQRTVFSSLSDFILMFL